jgi:hypothetical protein
MPSCRIKAAVVGNTYSSRARSVNNSYSLRFTGLQHAWVLDSV